MKRENLKRACEIDSQLREIDWMLSKILDGSAIEVRMWKSSWTLDSMDITPQAYGFLTEAKRAQLELDKTKLEKELEELQ